MTTEELKQEIYNWMPEKPKDWREGQAVLIMSIKYMVQQETLNLVTM